MPRAVKPDHIKPVSYLKPGFTAEIEAQIRATVRGQAHFANTGPLGTTCGECRFRGYDRAIQDAHGNTLTTQHVGGCAKYRELAGKHGPALPASTPSCRYYQRTEQ